MCYMYVCICICISIYEHIYVLKTMSRLSSSIFFIFFSTFHIVCIIIQHYNYFKHTFQQIYLILNIFYEFLLCLHLF